MRWWRNLVQFLEFWVNPLDDRPRAGDQPFDDEGLKRSHSSSSSSAAPPDMKAGEKTVASRLRVESGGAGEPDIGAVGVGLLGEGVLVVGVGLVEGPGAGVPAEAGVALLAVA
jgi:hypothetical protein